MAKCPEEGCSNFLADTADSDAPWFKASDILAKNNASYDVTIPKNIASGYYLPRHENLALHGASSEGGAQFYPVCVQLEVTGGGDMEPSGLSFPDAYNSTDAGILFNVYLGDESSAAYVPPGGDVYPGLND
ncbi:glycosyl hydrolase family 61-domain-containing protein [Desarmillaria ectypa]|nr:glycosyl hydrolase family 61-domain-containing protein [Desarmillaria ectypa]